MSTICRFGLQSNALFLREIWKNYSAVNYFKIFFHRLLRFFITQNRYSFYKILYLYFTWLTTSP